MPTDPYNLAEAIVGYPDGMNLGLDPLYAKSTQCVNAINVTFRGGIPRSRPSFEQIILNADIPFTLFQGSGIYSLDSGDQLICVLDGKIWAIHLETGLTFCLTDTYNLPVMTVPYDRVWCCQAEHFFIIQDGESIPVIIDPGTGTARLSDVENDEVPIGSIMAYGHGRLFVVPRLVGEEDGRRFFLAGDIMWPTQPEKLLKFTETQYLAGGGALSLPAEMGFITGLAFLRSGNTGSGIGALAVFARSGVSIFAVNAPRLTWQDIDISYVLFNTGGTLSPSSIIPINSDLIFRGTDGIRSLMYSTASLQTLSNVPISGAFGERLLIDTEEDLSFVYSADWNNYLMMTTKKNGNGWSALAVIDLNPATMMGQVMPAVASGFWTFDGLKSLHKARMGGTPCAIMVSANEGLLRLSRPVTSHSESISSRLYTGIMMFKSVQELKKLSSISISVSEVSMDSTIQIYFRPRSYRKWIPINTVSVRSIDGYGRYPFMTIPMSEGYGCDPITGESLDVADEFQFCLVVQGNLKIDKLIVKCSLVNHGSRLEENFTGDGDFPGIDLESTDYGG